MPHTEETVTPVAVPSDDPQRNGTDKKSKENEQKLSEEDQRIKEQVELLVARAADPNSGIAKTAAEQLADLLLSSSGSVASVPKPLKYIRVLYPDLERALQLSQDAALTRRLHDIMSFVAMTLELNDVRSVSLEHKMKGTQDDLASWGHEYLRFLAGCIAEAWKHRSAKQESTDHLDNFAEQIVQYMLAHQDEPSASDLLIELDQVGRFVELVDATNYRRIASYLAAMSKYLTRPTDTEVLGVVFNIYTKMEAYSDAMVVALELGDMKRMKDLFQQCKSKAVRLQMALLCARFKCFLEFDNEEDSLLEEANGNMHLSQLFRYTAQEMDAMAPKTPEEICKTADTAGGSSASRPNSLASAFVSGFANCAYGKDTYLANMNTYHYKQKEDHTMSTVAAHGLLYLWDHTEGLQAIDKFFYSSYDYIKAGACLASGIVMCGVRNPFDPALGLLWKHVSSPVPEVAIASILGLGHAYAGTCREDVKDLLLPILVDAEKTNEVQCFTAYALAQVYVGSADEDITETLLGILVSLPSEQVTETCVHYLILALGCMFLRCQEAADTLLDGIQALPVSVRRYTEIVLRSCAFAATGNVVTIQNFFYVIAENDDPDEADDGTDKSETEADKEDGKTAVPFNYKAAAVLGIALVAMGEELGTEMAKRAIVHALLADTVSRDVTGMSGRCAVPLAYALLAAGTCNAPVVETLNRLAHDSNSATASNSILAMGIVAAGSNNARVAKKLRNLAMYYQKERFSSVLSVVRLSQGLCAMGKGHLTLSPLLSDRMSVSPTALMGLLGVLHSAFTLENTILGRYHFMLFALTPSISPRMVLAVNEAMEPIKDGVQVRVGLPVDTVALPGKPKRVTGFQTHSTPVLLSSIDKVEVADPKYQAISSVIEGIFVVEEQPVHE